MRIIAGEYKGRQLKSPSGHAVRPTADRVRESVFAILSGRLTDAVVLDLFAGSGALGLEALSRGARRVTFCERSASAIACLLDNVARCRTGPVCRVIRGDSLSWLIRLAASRERFDLLLADPPYNAGLVSATAGRSGAVLNPGGMLMLEHSRHEQPAAGYPGLELWRQERYGETMVSFFIRPAEPAAEENSDR
ncbi:MAG: 16S rRNA (guanine(966)-N(2))-methyltransferase RsmD [Negativicutes bacterium]|nr:16S rRNA (guanine(966)-N(2))-methyltransferase RsmD [Negativicutes bacterium]